MVQAVVDASALLALYFDEPGAEAVERIGESSAVSAVNWAEVAEQVLRRNGSVEDLRLVLIARGLRIEAVTLHDAERAAALREPTRLAGLSLADRCCLALAGRLGVPVYTADTAWKDPGSAAGIDVRLIR